MMRLFGTLALSLVTVFAMPAQGAEFTPTPGATEILPADVVPVTKEPLHIVRLQSTNFLIYTNHIFPGSWTLYHQHRNDLLAVIAGDTVSLNQAPNGATSERVVPAGTVVLFPYADMPSGYVHRVSVAGDKPFINVGLEFLGSVPSPEQRAKMPEWSDGATRMVSDNRRGRAYDIELATGQTLALPRPGSALLLVALGDALLALSGMPDWSAHRGDFQFHEAARPAQIENKGRHPARLILFNAY